MTMKILLKQLLVVAIFLLVTVVSQTALFKTNSNSWLDALFTKQWLWTVYFFVSHVLVECVVQLRNLSKRMDD